MFDKLTGDVSNNHENVDADAENLDSNAGNLVPPLVFITLWYQIIIQIIRAKQPCTWQHSLPCDEEVEVDAGEDGAEDDHTGLPHHEGWHAGHCAQRRVPHCCDSGPGFDGGLPWKQECGHVLV